MKGKHIVTAAALLASASSLAMADVTAGNTYAGGQFTWTTVEVDGIDDGFQPTAAVGRFGHFIVDNFALEGRAGVGISDDSITFAGIDVEGEIDHMVGLYGVGFLPLGESPVSLYGLVGFTQAEATVSAPDFDVSETDDDSGFSYGVGVQGHFTPQLSGNLEYTMYLGKSDYEVNGISLGLNYHF